MASQNLLPPVLEIEFGDELQSFAADDQKFSQRLIIRTKAGIVSILKALGIPGDPAVEIRSAPSAVSFRAYLNGSQIRYSRETFRSIWEYFTCSSIGELPVDYYWDRWLADNVTSSRNATDTQRSELIADFLASLIVESAKQYPERLFAHEQVVSYLAAAGLPGFEEAGLNDPARLLSILKPVLRLRISIADTAAVVSVISDGISMGCSDEDIAENLIARLRPRLLEIKCNPNYLSQWVRFDTPLNGLSVGTISESEGQVLDTLSMMSNGLLWELGVRVPEIKFVGSTDLKENSFAFNLNNLETIPRLGLGANRLLVNDTKERLSLINVEGSPTVNPANNNECSVIAETDRELVSLAGLSVWNPFEYLVLACARELRANASCFLDVETVEYEVSRLHEKYPELALATAEAVTFENLTRILRKLLREQIFIRDIKTVIERVLSYDQIVSEPAKYIIFDDRHVVDENLSLEHVDLASNYAQHVRVGLRRYIGHKYTRGQNTLIVYLISPEIETMLIEHPFDEEPERERTLAVDKTEEILSAIHDEVDSLPDTANRPVILTTSAVRTSLRQMIAAELPNLAVLSYEELPPDMNIQPIARIELK